MGTVREVREMSRYIDAEALEKRRIDYIVDGYADSVDDMVEWGMAIIEAPTIDLDDYVPKDFHDKTCEAMAKAHQEEIADMVSVVRCKECKYDGTWKCRWRNTQIPSYPSADDFCSYGERKEE